MELKEVEELTLEIMSEFGMNAPYWKFKFNNSKSYAGLCYKSNWNGKRNVSGRIELSRLFMEAFDRAEVEETIRHEVAHGLTDPKYRPHGPEWKANARKVGSNGSRCVSINAPKIDSRYLGTCPNGHKFTRHKKTDVVTSYKNSHCPPCSKKLPRDQYAFISWVDTKTGETMNPSPYKTIRVPVAAQTKPKVGTTKGLDTSKPRELSWKQKFDAGMTSFDNDW